MEIAQGFFARAKGLIGRDSAPADGLLIPNCKAIHTCFMRFPIDATFLDKEDRVVKVVRNIRPWRLLVWGGWRAVKVVETNVGEASRLTEGK